MAFRLASPEEKAEREGITLPEKRQPPSAFQQALEFTKGIGQAGATIATGVGSDVLGLPGDLFSTINELIARPVTKHVLGQKDVPFQETLLGKVLPTSAGIKRDIHKALPFTKPRGEFQEFTNELLGTAALLMIPGGQAEVGLTRAPRLIRALLKSTGAHVGGELAKNLSGSEETGNYATMGSLFLLSLMDRPGSGRYISGLYNQARQVLGRSGNPTVNAGRLTNNLTNLRNNLSTGTLAPSEAAVVQDIDRTLAHIQNGRIGVENLWGSSRSMNERRTEALTSAAGRQGRLRARRLYDQAIGSVNDELGHYSQQNPAFGQPFMEAQRGFATTQQSNLIARTLDKITGLTPRNSGLLHLFGGAGAAALGLGKGGGVMTPTSAVVAGGYQLGKILYRVFNSSALRRYYMGALRDGVQGNVPQMANKIQKMDKILVKEDEKKKPYRLVKPKTPPRRKK